MAPDTVIEDIGNHCRMDIIPEGMEPATDLPADTGGLVVPGLLEPFKRVGIVEQGVCRAMDPARDLRVAERLVAEFLNNAPACPGSVFREIAIRAAQ
jgi:hypothetical protein